MGFIGRTGHLVLCLGGLLFSAVMCRIHLTLLSVFPSFSFLVVFFTHLFCVGSSCTVLLGGFI